MRVLEAIVLLADAVGSLWQRIFLFMGGNDDGAGDSRLGVSGFYNKPLDAVQAPYGQKQSSTWRSEV